MPTIEPLFKIIDLNTGSVMIRLLTEAEANAYLNSLPWMFACKVSDGERELPDPPSHIDTHGDEYDRAFRAGLQDEQRSRLSSGYPRGWLWAG